MKKLIIFVILLGLYLSQFVYAVNEGIPEEYTQLISSYVTNFNNKDFLEAAKLFHYPKKYTVQELERDTYCVSKFLEYFNKEFGEIKEMTPVKNGDKYYSVEIYGGDKSYWQKNPKYNQLEYQVSFSQEGQGYLILWLCNISRKIEIRTVKYAISASKDNAKVRIYDEIIKGMDGLNNELMNSN